MKIGIDAHTLGSQSSGNEHYYLQLITEFAKGEFGSNRYVVYFTRMSALQRIPKAEHFDLKRIWPRTPYFRIPFAFPMECRLEKLDVFHAQFIVPPFCNCGTVTTIPDILFEAYPEFFAPVENLWLRALIPWSARRADHIITVSHFSKSEIVNRYHISPEKITVTNEAPRDEFRVLDKEECREQISRRYRIDSPFVLYVGRVQARKNLLRLLEAFYAVRRDDNQHKLVIVGKQDWSGQKVIQKVHELSIQSHVTFTGYVNWDDLPIFYNAAEAFVFPSICEGFGVPIVEAMACGLPVVTSYGSSLEEVAGGAAVLADPYSVDSIAKAMEKVLFDPNLRSSLRERGLRRAAEFSGSRKAQQTIAAYQKVCTNR